MVRVCALRFSRNAGQGPMIPSILRWYSRRYGAVVLFLGPPKRFPVGFPASFVQASMAADRQQQPKLCCFETYTVVFCSSHMILSTCYDVVHTGKRKYSQPDGVPASFSASPLKDRPCRLVSSFLSPSRFITNLSSSSLFIDSVTPSLRLLKHLR
jgi:hypothetical protein